MHRSRVSASASTWPTSSLALVTDRVVWRGESVLFFGASPPSRGVGCGGVVPLVRGDGSRSLHRVGRGLRRGGGGVVCLFFFQAEDGIRDLTVTGVQTCALPILPDLTPGSDPPLTAAAVTPL